MTKSPLKRCAIYTRKSQEEGLEMEFNSLHAQREACEAFIKSQKHEGWQLIKTAYDDGGISGGTMERPALKQLLADIRDNKVDVIVVYKVDRLTRSLHDFAKMVEIFDKHNVSFVSVTQQFNTTSSMGRLTLNVLLSFAQFEREVTGERIRDKIAASKAKGMWMGGNIPLGYKVVEKKLIIVPEAAETVRHIFRRYLELGCVRLLQEDITNSGIRSVGGYIISRGTLYKMLSNPTYLGQIRHKEICYPGQHEPIIDQSVWDAVQQQLNNNAPIRQVQDRKVMPSLLIGKLFDESGDRMAPSHANKKGRRYRYYVSYSLKAGMAGQNNHGWRLPAQEIEQTIAQAARAVLGNHKVISGDLTEAGFKPEQIPKMLKAISEVCDKQDDPGVILKLVERVDLRQDSITLKLSLESLIPADSNHHPVIITRDIPMQMKRRGVEMRLVIGDNSPPKTDNTLIKTIARAKIWADELMMGRKESITAIAARAGVSRLYVTNLLPLAFLDPETVNDILEGKQPANITSEALSKHINLPITWPEQERLLRFN